MNNWLVALIVWAVFAVIIIIADHKGAAELETWLYIILTAPLTVPAMAVLIPYAFALKIWRKLNLKYKMPSFKKNKKWY